MDVLLVTLGVNRCSLVVFLVYANEKVVIRSSIAQLVRACGC